MCIMFHSNPYKTVAVCSIILHTASNTGTCPRSNNDRLYIEPYEKQNKTHNMKKQTNKTLYITYSKFVNKPKLGKFCARERCNDVSYFYETIMGLMVHTYPHRTLKKPAYVFLFCFRCHRWNSAVFGFAFFLYSEVATAWDVIQRYRARIFEMSSL